MTETVMKVHRTVTILRRSCLTGKVVWIYRGPSEAAARVAYWRACKREIEFVRSYNERAARRAANIARLLADCTASIPINAELTPQQAEAARELKTIEKKEYVCDREFYNHIMEERRRRQEDREIRRQMRERENKNKKP